MVGQQESPLNLSIPSNPDASVSLGGAVSDEEFEAKLNAVRRAAEEKKRKLEEEEKKRAMGPIDYDAPPLPQSGGSESFGRGGGGGGGGGGGSNATKIGAAVAAALIAAVFIFSDIFVATGPGREQKSSPTTITVLSEEEKQQLEGKLAEYEQILKDRPNDRVALEGAAVMEAELGDYPSSEKYLMKLVIARGGGENEAETYRLLGEVRLLMGKAEESADAYKKALKTSRVQSGELLQGLASALLAANRPQDAVVELLAVRERIQREAEVGTGQTVAAGEGFVSASGSYEDTERAADPVEVELLLGKVYTRWGRTGDAAAVYDGLISSRPDDFRGYLAKGLLLKSQGRNDGEAQKMFLQAKYLAPEQAQPLIQRLEMREREKEREQSGG